MAGRLYGRLGRTRRAAEARCATYWLSPVLSYAYCYALLVRPLGGTREALDYLSLSLCIHWVTLWALFVGHRGAPCLAYFVRLLRPTSAYPVGP